MLVVMGFRVDKCTLRPRKQVEVLHKPIDNLPEVLARLGVLITNYICVVCLPMDVY